MKTTWQFLLIAALSALLGACAQSPESPETSAQQPSPQKITGVVRQPDGQPAAGLPVRMVGTFGSMAADVKTDGNGKFELDWDRRTFAGLNDSTPCILVRDVEHGLAVAQDLDEGATNLDLKLAPALTLAGRVEFEGKPITNATAAIVFWTGNTGMWLQGLTRTNTPSLGRFEIPAMPPGRKYGVIVSAPGYGQKQLFNFEVSAVAGRQDLDPVELLPANVLIAGQVLDANDKPASGVNVQLNGDNQPSGSMTTDSKGRFHFQVCDGQVRLFAYSQNGSGNAQVMAYAGDTNVVMNLNSSSGSIRQTPSRAPLKGSPLPDLTTVNLTADAAPAGKPVLLCLFDAGQRPSRHAVNLLEQQAAALRQKNVSVFGVQAATTGDEIFNNWKTASPVSFPVGRLTEKSAKSRWASDVPALPWLLLADANHRIVAEGFSLDELDAQIQKLK